MTTYVPTALVPIAALPNAVAIQFTAPANTPTQISTGSFTNTDTTNRSVTLYLVASGGAPSAANKLIAARTIAPGATITPIELAGRNLAPGDSIRAFADVAAKVNMVIDGYEISASS